MISIIAALITFAGAIAAALITNRQRGPAGVVAAEGGASWPARNDRFWRGRELSDGTAPASAPRISKAFWLGLAGLVAWIIPVAAYVLVLPGLYVGIREQNGPRRLTGTGIGLCAVSLALAVINSAVGAYQGAHGVGWWQQ